MSSFDDFWDLFDNKKSRDKCERKWHLMTVKDQQDCMDSLPRYIKETPDKQFRKHPATYLNNKSWQDTLYHKEEEKGKYRMPDPPKLSDYKPEEYPREKGISHMRDKLKRNYENGSPILDYGDIYTTLLTEKCAMNVPSDVSTAINQMETLEAIRKRNRFEESYSGTLESNVRDKKLNWFLKSCKESGRKIYEEI